MKKIFFIILLFVFFSAYIGSDTSGEYSNSSVLSHSVDKTVFRPVKDAGVSVYNNVVTQDFKDCVKLAVDNSLGAVKILFVNVIDTVIDVLSSAGSYVEESYKDL